MNLKKYTIEHTPTYGSIDVEIDFDHVNDFGDGPRTIEQDIKEMADFWATSKQRLAENNGDYLITFLNSLCNECLAIQFEKNYNTTGVVEEFNNKEGWFRMDGTEGFKITDVSGIELSNQEDYQIEEKL